jgi:hypothetical protein
MLTDDDAQNSTTRPKQCTTGDSRKTIMTEKLQRRVQQAPSASTLSSMRKSSSIAHKGHNNLLFERDDAKQQVGLTKAVSPPCIKHVLVALRQLKYSTGRRAHHTKVVCMQVDGGADRYERQPTDEILVKCCRNGTAQEGLMKALLKRRGGDAGRHDIGQQQVWPAAGRPLVHCCILHPPDPCGHLPVKSENVQTGKGETA